MVDVRAFGGNVSAVVDSTRRSDVFVSDETDVNAPREHAVAPFLVCRIASKTRKTSSELVKVAVADRVLVIVAVVERIDLPAQATGATLIVPAGSLLVEDVNGNVSPCGIQVCEHV